MTGAVSRGPAPLFVTGATGFIGRHLVARAVARGHRVTALVRDPAESGLPPEGLTLLPGDLTNPLVLQAGLRGVEAVVHLAAATRASDQALSRLVNVEGTRALIAACREGGVRRIVALSTLSVHNAVVGAYGATKREMERLLAESGLESVVLRPGLVYGPGARGLFHRITRLIDGLPVIPVVGRGAQPVYPVHVDDVVDAVLQCVGAPHVVGRSYDLVGPDVLSMREFLARVSRTLGRRRRLVPVPVPLAMVAAKAMGRVLSAPPLTVDAVIGATQTTPYDPLPARRDLQVRAIPLDEGLPTIGDPVPRPGDRPDQVIRIAVVGLGKMGVTHTALLSTMPGVRVAALVDVSPGLAAIVRGLGFRIPFFPSLGDALAATRPHGVVIATPNHLHAPLAKVAAERGIGALIEKPLADTLEAAADLVGTLERTGVPASCGYTLAYAPAFEKMKALLDAGVLGRLRRFHSSMFLSEVFGPRAGWRYERSKSGGGVLPTLTSHLLFLLHWFFGDAERVEARTERRFTEVDDAAWIRLTFAGGLAGTVETSWSVPGYPLSRTEVTVEGDNGRLVGGDEGLSLLLHAPAGGLPDGETRLRAADLPGDAAFDLGGEAYYREDAAFVEALRTGRPVPTSLGRALHVQAILDAIYRSVAAGGAPTIPTPTRSGVPVAGVR